MPIPPHEQKYKGMLLKSFLIYSYHKRTCFSRHPHLTEKLLVAKNPLFFDKTFLLIILIIIIIKKKSGFLATDAFLPQNNILFCLKTPIFDPFLAFLHPNNILFAYFSCPLFFPKVGRKWQKWAENPIIFKYKYYIL